MKPRTVNFEKILVAILALGLLILGGCDNFMTSTEDFKAKLKEEVEVANAESVTVTVQADPLTLGGTPSPLGPDVQKKVGVSFSLSTTIDPSMVFAGWTQVGGSGEVVFADASKATTSAQITKAGSGIVIQANYDERLKVMSTLPDDGEIDVEISRSIVINFSKPIKASTAILSNIKVQRALQGSGTLTTITSKFANPTVNLNQMTIPLISGQQLGDTSNKYDIYVTISKNITDLFDNKMAADYNEFKFVTSKVADTTAPTIGVISVSNVRGALPSGNLTNLRDIIIDIDATDGASGTSGLRLKVVEPGVGGRVYDDVFQANLPFRLETASGSKVLAVTVTDSSNNATPKAGGLTVVFDDTLPVVTNLSVAGGAVYSSNQTVNIGYTPPTDNMILIKRYKVSENADPAVGAWLAAGVVPSTYTFASATNGTKNVYLYVEDGAGNVSLSTTDSIIFDNTPPTFTTALTVASGAAATNLQTVGIAYAALDALSGVASYQVSESATAAPGGTWLAAPTTYLFSNTTNETKTVYVYAKDIAGNISSSSSDSIVFDTIKPTINISAPSIAVVKSGTNVTYTVTYSGASTISLSSVNLNKVNTADSSNVSVGGMALDSRTVTISNVTGDGTLGISIPAGSAVDAAGNTADLTGPSTTFTVDNTAPLTTGAPVKTTAPALFINTANMMAPVDVAVSIPANAVVGDTIELLYQGASFTPALTHEIVGGEPGTATVTFTVPTGQFNGSAGTNTLTTRVTDVVGNTPAVSSPLTVTKDTTAPTYTLATSGTDTDIYVKDADSVVVTATFSEAISAPTINIAGYVSGGVMSESSPTVWTYSWNVPNTPSVANAAVGISASDPAGNPVAWSGGITGYTIDNTSPAYTGDAYPVMIAPKSPWSTTGKTYYTGISNAAQNVKIRHAGDTTFGIKTILLTGNLAATQGTPIVYAVNGSVSQVVLPSSFSFSGGILTVTLSSPYTGTSPLLVSTVNLDMAASMTVSAQLVDIAGNGSAVRASQTCTGDNTAPVTNTFELRDASSDSASYATASTVKTLITYTETGTGVSTITFGGAIDTTNPFTAGVSVVFNGTTYTKISGDAITVGIDGTGTAPVINLPIDCKSSTNNTITVNGLNLSSGDGSKSVSVVLADAGGNSSTSVNDSINKDTTDPTVSITMTDTSIKIGDTPTVTFTFSESVSGFVNSDVTIENGTLSAIAGTGSSYTATFTPTVGVEDSSNVITVAAGSYVDAAGNNGVAGTSAIYSVETTAPTVSITMTDTSIKIGDMPTVTFTFNESVTGFVNSDVTIENGTLSSIAGTGSSYTATFTPSSGVEDSSNVITVAVGSYADAAGNTGSAGTSPIYSVETTAPTVSITMGASSFKIGDTTTVTFTFSESVTGFANSDITIANGSLSALSGSGSSYTATFTPAAGVDETVNVITVAAGSYADTAGNVGAAGTSPSYSVETTAPTVSITMADTSIKIGDMTTVTFTFSESVTGFANSDVTIENGTLSAIAGSGSSYTATFTPSAGVEDTTNVITVAAGSYVDAVGNTGSLGTSANYTVDTLAPVIPAKTGWTVTVAATYSIAFLSNITGASSYSVTPVTAAVATATGITSIEAPVTTAAYTLTATDAAGNETAVAFTVTNGSTSVASRISTTTGTRTTPRSTLFFASPEVLSANYASSARLVSWLATPASIGMEKQQKIADNESLKNDDGDSFVSVSDSSAGLLDATVFSPAALHAQAVARARSGITERTQQQPVRTAKSAPAPEKPISPPAESAENNDNGANAATATGSSSISGITPAAVPASSAPGTQDSPQSPCSPAAPGSGPVNTAMPVCMPRGSKEEEAE